MALLIIGLDKQIGSAGEWRDTFKAQLPNLEIRIWPEAPTDPPKLPMSILLLPVVRLEPAKYPIAILLLPVVLMSAPAPLAVF